MEIDKHLLTKGINEYNKPYPDCENREDHCGMHACRQLVNSILIINILKDSDPEFFKKYTPELINFASMMSSIGRTNEDDFHPITNDSRPLRLQIFSKLMEDENLNSEILQKYKRAMELQCDPLLSQCSDEDVKKIALIIELAHRIDHQRLVPQVWKSAHVTSRIRDLLSDEKGMLGLFTGGNKDKTIELKKNLIAMSDHRRSKLSSHPENRIRQCCNTITAEEAKELIEKQTYEANEHMSSIAKSNLRLQETLQIETKKALEELPNGPINQTRFDRDIVNACKLLFGPNKDKVEYKDGKVIYRLDQKLVAQSKKEDSRIKKIKEMNATLRNKSEKGDLDQVKDLVEKGADINEANNDGWTPLDLASINDHLDIVKYLAEKGADINQADIEINLTRAVKLGSLETASVTLAQDAPEIFYDVLIGIQDPAPASTIRDTVKKLTLKECKDLKRYLQEDEGIISNWEHLLEEVTYEERDKVIIELTELIELHESQYKEAEGIYQKDSDPSLLNDENVRNFQNINKFARSPEKYLNKKQHCIKTLLALNIVFLKARNDKLADTDISHSTRHEMQCVFRHDREVVDMKGIISSSGPGGDFKPERYKDNARPYMYTTTVIGRQPGIGKDGKNNHEHERTSTGPHVAIHHGKYGKIILQANCPNILVEKFNINPNYLQDLFKLDDINLKEKITELIKLGLDPTFSHYSGDSKSLLDLALEKNNDIVLRAIMNGPFDLGDIFSKTKKEYHPTLLDKITRDGHTYSKIQILIKILTLQEECRTKLYKKRGIPTPKTENKLIEILNSHLNQKPDPELAGGGATRGQSTHDILKINIKSQHLDIVNREATLHYDRNDISFVQLITDVSNMNPAIDPKVFFDCLGDDMLEYQLKQEWSEDRHQMQSTMNGLSDDFFDSLMRCLGGAKISEIILHNSNTGWDGKGKHWNYIHLLDESKINILTNYIEPEQLIIGAIQNRATPVEQLKILEHILLNLDERKKDHIKAIKHERSEIRMGRGHIIPAERKKAMEAQERQRKALARQREEQERQRKAQEQQRVEYRRTALINSIETRQREYTRAADRYCMLLPWRTARRVGGVRETKQTYLAEVAAALKITEYGERKLAVNRIIAKYKSPVNALEMATIKGSFFGGSKCKKIHSQLEALHLKAAPPSLTCPWRLAYSRAAATPTASA